MAIGMIMQFTGVHQEQYDAVMEKMGIAANWPQGIVSHVAGATDVGWVVVDVWESRQQFDSFFETRLKPAFQAAGGLPEPKVTFFQVHNRFPAT